MSVDLNREVCAQCGTRLTDRSTVVENDGQLYCCANCMFHATHSDLAGATRPSRYCAHCGQSIVVSESQVQRGPSYYCCANCANAFEQVGPPVQ